MAGRIPPHLTKELRRHIQNNTEKIVSSNAQKEEKSRRYSTLLTLAGAVTFLGFTSSIPFLVTKWVGPLNERDSVSSPWPLCGY
jgi:hypothetical protein